MSHASDTIAVGDLRQAICRAARELVDSEPLLTRVDSLIGDGDHGAGMRIGFTAVAKLLEGEFQTVHALFRAVGMELVRTMGGASGVLFGTLFIGGLQHLPEARSIGLGELAGFFETSVAAIRRRGRANPGDKTMVDALLPAVRALRDAADAGKSVPDAFRAADDAAREGMEATKAMRSRIGRAKNFGDRTLGHPDAGAVSVAILFHAWCGYFTEHRGLFV